MSRVITFSRTFPSYHPKAGQPTYFVEKILRGIFDDEHLAQLYRNQDVLKSLNMHELAVESIEKFNPKHHTIRAGHRWREGDWFSPRVWSGKPYNSKQITFASDIQIQRIWDVEFDDDGCMWIYSDNERGPGALYRVAKNDGLSLADLIAWFNKPFTGQIICWNDKVNY